MIYHTINTLRPRQNGRHFPDDIFKCIFLNENVWILIKISLKFVPNGIINKTPASVQIMAWRRTGDKPLSEPMLVSLPTHLCVTQPQWVEHGIISECSTRTRPKLWTRVKFYHIMVPSCYAGVYQLSVPWLGLKIVIDRFFFRTMLNPNEQSTLNMNQRDFIEMLFCHLQSTIMEISKLSFVSRCITLFTVSCTAVEVGKLHVLFHFHA